MFNAILNVEVLKVEPYSGDEGSGIILTSRLEAKERNVFDDLNLAGKAEGLSRIISGELPIKGASVKLAFVKPAIELEFGNSKHISCELVEVVTGPMAKGIITIDLKLDIHRLDKDLAGELSSKLKNIITIKLRKTQNELDLSSRKN